MIDIRATLAKQIAFTAGVVLHLTVFRIGEWDMATTSLINTFALLPLVATALLSRVFPDVYPSLLQTATAAATLEGFLILGVYTSMMIYRGWFHRLRKFPGPFLARFSNLYITALSAKNLHLYNEVQRLHQKYGDFVRVGPSEISINDPGALPLLQNNPTKGPWYNVLQPRISLHMIRDKNEHLVRRKIWDRAFSAKALRDYEPRVIRHANNLLEHLARTEGQPVNVSDWFNFFSFDVMGDLAWGKSFNMLRDGIKHYFMVVLHADMTNIGLFSHMLWLFPIFKATPILNAEHRRFWDWLKVQVSERRQKEPELPDVFSPLLEAHNAKAKPTEQEELDLEGDAYLIAVAGSDTVAASLGSLFFELACDQDSLKKLQGEVDELFEAQEEVTIRSLANLPFLDAVINEALRLHPPVPSGVQRVIPSQGMQIGDTFIPADTLVQVPTYTQLRDVRNFEKPDEFAPERWTTKPEMVKEAGVFMPFGTGRYMCIGKQLALMEIRWVTAQIVRRWDVAFAPGQGKEAFIEGQRDTFTLVLPTLNLIFTRRA